MLTHKFGPTIWFRHSGTRPAIFNGSFGQRPHKLSVASAAFAYSLNDLEFGEADYYCYALCLGTVLGEIDKNGHLYPFNGIDIQLIENSLLTMTQVSTAIENSDIGKEFGGDTYEF